MIFSCSVSWTSLSDYFFYFFISSFLILLSLKSTVGGAALDGEEKCVLPALCTWGCILPNLGGPAAAEATRGDLPASIFWPLNLNLSPNISWNFHVLVYLIKPQTQAFLNFLDFTAHNNYVPYTSSRGESDDHFIRFLKYGCLEDAR